MLKFIYLRYSCIAIVRNSNLVLINFSKSLSKNFLTSIGCALETSVISNYLKKFRYIKFPAALKLIII
jgi:hypothetical protein